MSNRRIGVIATISGTGGEGGAERFYNGLVAALNEHVPTERIDVVSDESSFEAIEETYLRFYDLDMSEYAGVISTKAPAYMVRHPNHVLYLQHTMRVFYDMFDREFPHPDETIIKQRALVQRLDTLALQAPRTRDRFVIGKEVQKRLRHYNGLDSQVLYQATTLSGFECRNFEYVFIPGRLHRWKRLDLIINALKYVKSPVKVLISGEGEDGAYFRSLASDDNRITFLGRVSDRELIELYAGALVVPFVPIREDFGLITLEAFHSGKPVLTCMDSGEPANIVQDGVSGFVCEPVPHVIGEKLEYLFQNPGIAMRMGQQGRESVKHITWQKVANALIKALDISSNFSLCHRP